MTTSHYIAGRWVEGQGSDCISVNDPALGQPFAELMAASVAQVDQAVTAARGALPAWKTPAPANAPPTCAALPNSSGSAVKH